MFLLLNQSQDRSDNNPASDFSSGWILDDILVAALSFDSGDDKPAAVLCSFGVPALDGVSEP